MREIKFRGKSKENGKWYYGYYCKEHNNACFAGERIEKHYIRFQDNMDWNLTRQMLEEVDEDTVGQFTGLKDINGVDIYEGDIIKTTHATLGYGKREKQVEVISKVIFYLSDGVTMSGYPTNNTPKFTTVQLNAQAWREVAWSMFHRCEVIGNIYDNKELLESDASE